MSKPPSAPVRLAYVTRYEEIHDGQFVSAFDGREDIDVLFVILAPELPKSLPKLRKTKVIRLYHPAFPIDDPLKPGYPWRTRVRIHLGHRYYAHKLKRIFREERIDVVQGGWILADGIIAAGTGFHPLVIQPVGSDVLLHPDRDLRTRRMTRDVLTSADYISCDAETVRRKILEIAPEYPADRFILMPCGVDIDRFFPAAALPAKPTMIMTRGFRPVYNIPFFIDVLAEVRKRVPDLRVTLIGDGNERPEIERRIESHGLADCIRLLGFLPGHRIAEELRSATLYVSTSLSDGTSVSLLEAMATGLPCAVSDIPANREWVSESSNGVLLDPRDVTRTTRKIAELLQNPAALRTLGIRSRAVAVERANWKENVTKLVGIYRQLAKMDPL